MRLFRAKTEEDGNTDRNVWATLLGFLRSSLIVPTSSFLILTLAGCGYTQQGDAPAAESSYQWRSLYRQDIKSVAVPIFTNKDFHRGVEFQLTKALVTQIESQTPYKVVPKERADSILEGQITKIGVSTVSQDNRTALPQEQLYVITVDFTWKDLRNGRLLVERRNFEQTMPFYPTIGEGYFVGSQEGSQRLALGIVQEMQADW